MKRGIISLLVMDTLLVTFFSCCTESASDGVFDKCSVIASQHVISGDTLVICDISAVKESFKLPLSLLVDSLEIVKLDNREEAIVGKGRVTVSENFMGVYDFKNYSYKLFTRQGKFVRTIGAIGQGPGEYKMLYDNQIDEINNRIYLFPWTTKKVLVYDLDGNFIQDISLPRLVHKGCLAVDTSQERMSILNLPFTDNPVAWVQDFDGNVISEKMAPQLELLPDYSNEITHIRYGNLMSFSLLHIMPVADSLYHYDGSKNRLSSVFTATFSEDMPVHYFLDLPGFYGVDIIGPSTDPDYTGTVNKRIIIDKQTLRGGYYQLIADQLGGIPFEGGYYEYGCIVNIEPGQLLEQIEKRLSVPEKLSLSDKHLLVDLKNEISEDDNNYVILGKWKE